MKKLYLLLLLTLLAGLSNAQNIEIPDTIFLHALIDKGVDTNGDSLISYAEAEEINRLVFFQDISDVQGIEAFINLDTLAVLCQLTTLDISNNTALKFLDCRGNNLTSLDVSKNIALLYLECEDNQLTSLDVSTCTSLHTLYCHSNKLTSLDVSNCTSLTGLGCGGNQLTYLDLSNNNVLDWLSCGKCQPREFCEPDGPSNQLTTLDLRKNNALKELFIDGMPTLYEVCVWTTPFPPDSVIVDTTGSPNVYFTTECVYNNDSIVFIPDTAFLHALIDKGVDTNGDSLISSAEAEAATNIDVSGEGRSSGWTGRVYCEQIGKITSLKGIEAFTNLDTLICHCNLINNLDLSSNTELTYLECGGNPLNNLDVSNNPSMNYLNCSNSELTSLDISGCPALELLWCIDNQLTNLDVSGCTALKNLACDTNQLESLDVSDCISLEFLCCSKNNLTSLDVSNNTALIYLDCSYSQLDSLDISLNSELRVLWCDDNNLSSLDVSLNTALTDLVCCYNQLTSLDLSNNAKLQKLYCYSNQLTSLDVSLNTDLRGLYCSNNQLDSLDISLNTNLRRLFCDDNLITTLDVSNNPNIKTLSCGGNLLTYLDISLNTYITSLLLRNIPTLHKVCVWKMPFPPYLIKVDTTDSPSVEFQDCSTGIEENKLSGISIYPNPTNGSLTVETAKHSQHSIEITSLNGQLLYNERIEGTTHQIDLAYFQKGIYFITVRSKDSVTTEKIIIQ